MKKISSIIIVICFFALLLLPQVFDKFIELDRSTANEKRNLTKFPEEFKYRKIASQLEEYYNDRIPFRPVLLKYCRKLQGALFALAPGYVLQGKNDFFFYQPGNWENTIDHFCGKRSLRYSELEERRKFILKLHNFLQREKIDFLFVIAPNKIQVYPEYLPERRRYQASAESPDLQFVKHVQKHHPEIPLLHLLNDLTVAKQYYGDMLYYRADTHWSAIGGYIGAIKIINHFEKDKSKRSISEKFQVKQSDKLEPDDMHNQMLHPEKAVKYPAMLPDVPFFSGDSSGTARHVLVTKNLDAPDPRKVVIYRDSYTNNMLPYISNHFREVHYIWTHRVSREMIRSIKPDIVIVEYVARLTYNMQTKLR